MHMAETSASACFRAPLGQTAVAKRVAYLAEGRLRQMLLPTKHALTSDRHVVHRWSWPRAPTGSTDPPLRGNLWGSSSQSRNSTAAMVVPAIVVPSVVSLGQAQANHR